MKYLPPESPLRRLIEINALDAETCEQIIREVEQYVVDRYETIEPRLRLSVTVTIPAEHSISGAAFSFAVHYDDLADEKKRLYQIIDGRIKNGRPTILVTNLDRSELVNLLTERVVSRVIQSSYKLFFTGRCRREQTRHSAEEVF